MSAAISRSYWGRSPGPRKVQQTGKNAAKIHSVLDLYRLFVEPAQLQSVEEGSPGISSSFFR